ncbi:hypothetical protein Fmac_012291 [Flemingia macrophylla]|uniref:TIR domain-containing protein n=1 Tax=Flemingia macrophylla TaxID=520843 RepID=A0ABD1MPV5_9FABA
MSVAAPKRTYLRKPSLEGFSRDVFPSIIWSWMSPTNSLSSRIQTSSGTSSLVSLDVPNSNIHNLSYVFEDLPKLQSLFIDCDSELQLTREVKSIVDALYATNSEQSESTSTTSQMPNINSFTLIECNNQVHTSGSENLLGCHLIQIGKSCQVTHNLRQSILQNKSSGECDYLPPGDNHPDWLTFNSEGSSVIFEVPQVDGRNLKTMMCHIHFSSPDNTKSCGLINLLVINHTKNTIQVHKRDALSSCDNEKWQKVLSNTESGNKVEIVVVYERKLIVKRTTVYLIYEPIYEEMEHYQASNKSATVSSGDENIPYSQHSEFQTVSSVSVPRMNYPQGYTTNSGLSRAPAQQSQNWTPSHILRCFLSCWQAYVVTKAGFLRFQLNNLKNGS